MSSSEIKRLRNARECRSYLNRKRDYLSNDKVLAEEFKDRCLHLISSTISTQEIEDLEDLAIDACSLRPALKLVPTKEEIEENKIHQLEEFAPRGMIDLEVKSRYALGNLIGEVNREMTYWALRKSNNNRTKTAKILGVSVRTLRNWLKEWGHYSLTKQED